MICIQKLLAICLALGLPATSTAEVMSPAKYRELSSSEVKTVVRTLLSTPLAPVTGDAQCRDGPNDKGPMTIARGIASQLIEGANQDKPVYVLVRCFSRDDWPPLSQGQEHCELAFQKDLNRDTVGYGLNFVMDWRAGKVVPDSVDCYGYD
jgi:hypothetical protein